MKHLIGKKIADLRSYLEDKQEQKNRIILFAKASIIINAAIAAGKIGMSVYSLSLFLFVGGLYNVGIGVAKAVAVTEHHYSARQGFAGHEYRNYYPVGVVILLTSLAYMGYSFRTIDNGKSNMRYDLITAITIAAFTFTEIGTALYGISKFRREKTPTHEAIKMTNLVSSLISLVMTQAALLSLYEVENAARYCGIVGVILGGASTGVGLYIILHGKRQDSGK